MQNIEIEILKTIKGLALPTTMSDKQKLKFNQDLDVFIETLPNKTYEMTKLFIVRDYTFLLNKLTEMVVALNRIHADEAAKKCYQLVDAVRDDIIKSELDIRLEKLISELSALSIDIQLAQNKSNIEKHQRNNGHEQKNILAVDDEPVILNMLKKIIGGDKYKLSCAVSGEAALRYLGTHTLPDLLILDIEMPAMNGYELAENIVSKGFDIPIIFLTSNATREHVLRAIQVGASDFIVKPADKDLVLNKLQQYLG